jgi:hypothetical protein
MHAIVAHIAKRCGHQLRRSQVPRLRRACRPNERGWCNRSDDGNGSQWHGNDAAPAQYEQHCKCESWQHTVNQFSRSANDVSPRSFRCRRRVAPLNKKNH